MRRKRFSRLGRALLAAVCLSLVGPTLGFAQGGPGFLFQRPAVTIKFETGYGIHSANSEVFQFVRDTFTVGRHDFDGPYIGGELAYRASERLDIAFGAGLIQKSIDSEFRFWVDNNDDPIEQVMTLRVVPITLSAKYYFRDRGRTVGRFAWVPNALNPYVGAGAGIVSYRFEMVGDFVDYDTLDIFHSTIRSTGKAAMARGLAGVSISLGRQFEVSGEARYTLANGDMGRAFEGFEALDLNGFQGVVGIAVRF